MLGFCPAGIGQAYPEFGRFVTRIQANQKNVVLFSPSGRHDPSPAEFQEAYRRIFEFLDSLN